MIETHRGLYYCNLHVVWPLQAPRQRQFTTNFKSIIYIFENRTLVKKRNQ